MIEQVKALYCRNSIVRMKQPLLIIFLSVLVLSGCNIFNPKEPVPTYLHLEPFMFQNPDSGITGSSSHAIPSVKIFANNQPVGSFDLPCTVPVLITKNSSITMFADVTNQGLKSYVFDYPFYTSDTFTLPFNPGHTYSYTPKTRYNPALTLTNFPIKNNFDEGPGFEKTSGDTGLLVVRSPDMVYQGSGSGAIFLRTDTSYSENKSKGFFTLPNVYTSIYLELDYKSTIPFQFGLQGENDAGSTPYGEYLAGFNPKSEWTKIYIELASWAKTYSTYTKFYLKLRSSNADWGGKYTSGYVLFDNIKVISR